MRKEFRVVAFVSCALLSLAMPYSFGTATSQTSDAKEIVLATAAACRNLRNISYQAKFERESGSPVGPPITITAAVIMTRNDPAATSIIGRKRLARGVVSHPPDNKQEEFYITLDGQTLRTLDKDQKTVIEARLPDQAKNPQFAEISSKLWRDVEWVFLAHLTNSNPFEPQLRPGASYKYNGVVEVDGVRCHDVTIEYSSSRAGETQRWSERLVVGIEDHLPRVYEGFGTRLTMTAVKINIPVKESDFTIDPPSAYSVTRFDLMKAKGLLPIGTVAPIWRLDDPVGKTFILSDYRGKFVLMDFWATWCLPCKLAMPVLQKLHEKHKDRLAVIGIDALENEESDPVGYVKEKGYTYTFFFKGDEVAKAFGIKGLPTLYLIDENGKIIYAEEGFGPERAAALTQIVKKALSKKE